MDEQVFLSGFEPPEYHEMTFLKRIWPQLESVVVANGLPNNELERKATKSYSVVSFKNVTAFRLYIRGKQRYISFLTAFSDVVPKNISIQKTSATKYSRIRIDHNSPVDSYLNILIAFLQAAIDRYPKDWDCCSRYMECSNAMKCVHPDPQMALVCGYRHNLNEGHIFYGKNRNV